MKASAAKAASQKGALTDGLKGRPFQSASLSEFSSIT